MTIDVKLLAELLDALGEYGNGVTIRQVYRGYRKGGFGSSEVYKKDGWEIGWIDANGGDEIAFEDDLNVAMANALEHIQTEWGD